MDGVDLVLRNLTAFFAFFAVVSAHGSALAQSPTASELARHDLPYLEIIDPDRAPSSTASVGTSVRGRLHVGVQLPDSGPGF